MILYFRSKLWFVSLVRYEAQTALFFSLKVDSTVKLKEKEECENCRDIWHAALYLMYKFLDTEPCAKFSFKKLLTFLVRKCLKKTPTHHNIYLILPTHF